MAAKPNGHAEAGAGVTQSDDDYPIISGPSDSADDGSGIPTVEPSEISGSSDAPKRGRGRPRGSTSTKYTSDTKQSKQTAQDLSGILMGIHSMAAAFLKVPELELDQVEAKALGDAVNKVQAEYKIPILDPKTMAWINLLMVTGGVYGPRLAAHSIRKKNERKGKGTTINAQPLKVM